MLFLMMDTNENVDRVPVELYHALGNIESAVEQLSLLPPLFQTDSSYDTEPSSAELNYPLELTTKLTWKMPQSLNQTHVDLQNNDQREH